MQKWCSAHLFYDGSLDVLLIKGVKPFIEQYEDSIKSWFFIRYMEKGQHIRFRVLPKVGQSDFLKIKIHTHFQFFFQQYPSKTQHYNTEVFPNHSIQFIDYHAEVERYGGDLGISIAELYFHKSSNFIIHYIDEQTDNEQSILTAMIMNLYLVLAYSTVEIPFIFQTIYENWRLYNEQQLNLSKKEIITQFESIYNQSAALINEIVGLIINENITATSEIEGFDILKKEALETIILLKNTTLTKPISEIIKSYIHLNNNRLGISNFDESLIAYLILRGCS